MKIGSQDIQPMNIKELLKSMIDKGKRIFLLSLLGNFLILASLITILFLFFNYAYLKGADKNFLNTLRLLNNILILSLSSVHILYLLLGSEKETYFQQVKRALIKTLKVAPTLFVATLFYVTFVSTGFILLLIPGLILYAYLGIYSQIIAFENKGMISSLLRSRELVKGSFWKVFMILIAVFISINIVVIGIEMFLITYTSTYPLWLEIVVSSSLYILMMPFIASLYSHLYFDLRSRQEAFDDKIFYKEKSTIMS